MSPQGPPSMAPSPLVLLHSSSQAWDSLVSQQTEAQGVRGGWWAFTQGTRVGESVPLPK